MTTTMFDDPPAAPARATNQAFIPDPQNDKVIPDFKPSDKTTPISGFIEDPTTNAPTTVDPPAEDTVFEKVFHWAMHPILGKKRSEDVAGGVLRPVGAMTSFEIERGKKQVLADIKGGHNLRAAFDQFQTGVAESEGRLVQGLSSPASIGLAALSLGESIWGEGLWQAGAAGKAAVMAARGTQMAAGIGFGVQGGVGALTPRQEGESDADYTERVLLSSSQVFLATSGELAANKDIIRAFIRNRLKLSDNVADVVLGRIQKIAEARDRQAAETKRFTEEAAQKRRAIDTKKAEAVVRAEIQLEESMRNLESQTNARMSNVHQSAQNEIAGLREQVGSLDQRKVEIGTQIIADASHVAYVEKLRVQKPFEEIGDTFELPVGKKTEIKTMIQTALREAGATSTELPPAALKALGKVSQTETYIDAAGGVQPLEVVEGEEDVRFNDLGRVKDDLYGAAYANKDPQVRNGLFDAAQKIDSMQETAVLSKDMAKYPRRPNEGLSEYRKRLIRNHPQSTTAKYEAAKAEYTKFKRGIGSEMVNDWLSAYDMEDQEMSGKIAKLVPKEDAFGLDKTPSPTIALRDTLKSVGIDTSSFDRVLEKMKQAKTRARAVPKEAAVGERQAKGTRAGYRAIERTHAAREMAQARSEAREGRTNVTAEERARIAEIDKDTAAIVTEAEAKGAIVPSKTSSELAGLSNEQIMREQLNGMMRNARAGGIRNPSRLVLMVYGMFELVRGIKSGAFAFGYGAGAEFLPELVKDKNFQDWVVRESGVEPGNKRAIMGLKNGLTGNLYPALRRAVIGQAPAGAVGTATHRGEPADTVTFGEPPPVPDREEP